jgi:hypothetical protein
MIEVMVAQCSASPSDPAKAFFRMSAIGRMDRSTSSSTRPSPMKRVRPSQRDKA